MRQTILTIVTVVLWGVFPQAQADDGNPDTSLTPQTAWLACSTPQWRVWIKQRVADPGPSYPVLSTQYYLQRIPEGNAKRVYSVKRGWYPPVLAILKDGTLLLGGEGQNSLRWISPDDQAGGRETQPTGYGKEWSIVAGYPDGVLIASYRPRSSPPSGFVPFQEGQLDLAARISIPVGQRFQYYPSHMVRHQNTLAWIEGPSRLADKGASQFSRLVTFDLGTRKSGQVVLHGVEEGALLTYDGDTAVTTNGRFFDAATGKDLILSKEHGSCSREELPWYEELSDAATARKGILVGQDRVITVHHRVLYYVSVTRDDKRQPTEIRIMAGVLELPLKKPVCLLAFPYYGCRPLYNDSARHPEYLLSRQCIVGSDGISVWDGKAWATVPWLEQVHKQPTSPAHSDGADRSTEAKIESLSKRQSADHSHRSVPKNPTQHVGDLLCHTTKSHCSWLRRY